MKRNSHLTLLLLCAAGMPPSAPAQLCEAPLPVLAELMRQVIANQRASEGAEQEYLVHEQLDIMQNLEHCSPSCPGFPYRNAPRPPESGLLTMNYEKRESEVFWLDGVRVSRLLSSANSPRERAGSSHVFSPDDLQQENTHIGELVRNVLKARAEGKPNQELEFAGVLNGIRVSRFLELGIFSNPRRNTRDQRNSILVDYTGRACSQSCGPLDSAVQWITGTLTIDEEDRAAIGFFGNLDRSWQVPGDLSAVLPQDTEVSFSAEKVADRLWLPATMSISFDVSKHKRSFYDGETRWRAETIFLHYTDYKKFQVTSTILP